MIKNGDEYCCDCCGALIAKCHTDINYQGVDLLCDRCAKSIEETYKRLQRFQASGSDAPAPVPCYERGDLP